MAVAGADCMFCDRAALVVGANLGPKPDLLAMAFVHPAANLLQFVEVLNTYPVGILHSGATDEFVLA